MFRIGFSVENVVTYGDYRMKGYATFYLNFYRNAGYNSLYKTTYIQWIDM